MKFNFSFNNNFLKTSIGANIFAVTGLIFPPAYYLSFLFLSSKLGMGLVVVVIITIFSDFILSTFSIISFVIERFIGFRIRSIFFTENIAYSLVFYLGITLNIVFIYHVLIPYLT